MRRLALAALLLLAPLAAAAELATVRVFEVVARAEPRADAPAVHTFVEGTPLSVAEEATDGWRRVRLPDGTTAWLPESALALGPAAVASPAVSAAAPPAAAPAADLRPIVYVKDLGHLAELVRADPKVSPMAERLAARRKAAYGVGLAGIALSVGFMAYGMTAEPNPAQPGDPDFMKTTSRDRAFAGGVLGAIASTVVMLAIHPRSGELLDVVNAWNANHPEYPFTIERNALSGHR